MKKIFVFCIILLAGMAVHAQYVLNSNYEVWFEDTNEEMITRKSVSCKDNYQDLWNGCHVRLQNGYVYIYRGNSYFLYGEQISLLYNGYYRVKKNGWWYLYDEDGNKVSGVYGDEIRYYPFNFVSVKKNGWWYVYDCSGNRLKFHSDVSPWICSNGCWIIQQGSWQYGTDSDGDKISGVYGDEVSWINGRWKCKRGGYVFYKEVN